MTEEQCRKKLRMLGRELHKKPDGTFFILDSQKPGLWCHGPRFSLEQVEGWIVWYEHMEHNIAATQLVELRPVKH